MSNFRADNPFQRLDLSFEALSCLSEIAFPETIRPENTPLLLEVEPVREKGSPTTAPQIATRYNLVFPGSGFMRLSVKVEETLPSVAPEMVEKYRGIPVQVQGFSCWIAVTKDGGAIPYFRAEKIMPMKVQANN